MLYILVLTLLRSVVFQADPSGLGRVKAADAATFLKHSLLTEAQLSQVIHNVFGGLLKS